MLIPTRTVVQVGKAGPDGAARLDEVPTGDRELHSWRCARAAPAGVGLAAVAIAPRPTTPRPASPR